MINHARCLLLNQPARRDLGPLREVVPEDFAPVRLTGPLLRSRRVMLGDDPDPFSRQLQVRRLLCVLHASNFSPWVSGLDPRVTYDVREDVMRFAGPGQFAGFGWAPDVPIAPVDLARRGNPHFPKVYFTLRHFVSPSGGYQPPTHPVVAAGRFGVAAGEDLPRILRELQALPAGDLDGVFGTSDRAPFPECRRVWRARFAPLHDRLGAFLTAWLYRAEQARLES